MLKTKTIKTIKNNFRFISFLTLLILFGNQQIGQCQSAFSLGGEKWGLAFGNPIDYTGIRLNIIDFEKADKFSGLSFSLYSSTYLNNGISLSLISNNRKRYGIYENKKEFGPSNGVKVALYNSNGQINGLQMSIYNYCLSYSGKGVLIGLLNSHMFGNKCGCNAYQRGMLLGIINKGFTTKGLQVGFLNFRTSSTITFGIINFERSSYCQIGLINYTKDAKGIQIGLINYRKNNKWFAKFLPLINFKWEKKQ